MKNKSKMPPIDLRVIAGVGCNTASVKEIINFSVNQGQRGRQIFPKKDHF